MRQGQIHRAPQVPCTKEHDSRKLETMGWFCALTVTLSIHSESETQNWSTCIVLNTQSKWGKYNKCVLGKKQLQISRGSLKSNYLNEVSIQVKDESGVKSGCPQTKEKQSRERYVSSCPLWPRVHRTVWRGSTRRSGDGKQSSRRCLDTTPQLPTLLPWNLSESVLPALIPHQQSRLGKKK